MSRRLAAATLDRLGQSDPVSHATHRVLALQALELNWCVLVEELVDAQVATANLDLDLVSHASHADALRAKLVHAI